MAKPDLIVGGAVAVAALFAGSLGLARPRPVAPSIGRPARAAEVARVVDAGLSIARSPDGRYRVVDVAGEGAPRVGRIERRADGLWLVADADDVAGAIRLSGPLAIPRIAGPGYVVWVVGEVDAAGALRARRLGVLAPPTR